MNWKTLSPEGVVRAREPWDSSSDAVVVIEGTPDDVIAAAAGFEYFLEVALVRGLAEDLGATVGAAELIENVIYYAENDAYLGDA